MTAGAVARTGIGPGLRADPGSVGDRDVFAERRGDKVGVAIVRPPFVAGAVSGSVSVGNQDPCFQPPLDCRIPLVGDQFQLLNKNATRRESPFPGRCEPNLLVWGVGCAVVWHGKPEAFE